MENYWAIIIKSFLGASSLLGAMIAAIEQGYFDKIAVECGLEYYAERRQDWYPENVLSSFSMPINTIVNIGYLVVGIYWIFINTKPNDFWVKSFAWMSLLYGPIQFHRIISQTPRSAILDQWFTLPFFGWVLVWCMQKLGYQKCAYTVIPFSIFSFLLTLVTEIGFEIVLATHILSTVVLVLLVLNYFQGPNIVKYFFLSLICCFGFVFLKIFDLRLAVVHPFFALLSGHFWSKICDFMQIHYFCRMVTAVHQSKEKLI